VGDSIKIIMNGENGKVSVEADKVSVSASNGISLETDGNFKMSGRQVTTEGTTLIKNSSSGMLSLEGKPIKMG
jgi:hypothetical protein